MTTARSANYTVPAVTVLLGQVLDLQFERGSTRIRVDEWHGWQLLTTEDAMERAPGRARLFLLKGKLEPGSSLRSTVDPHTYDRWHQRAATKVLDLLNVPARISFFQGRCLTIGYRSDKWEPRGRSHDYEHSFYEGGHRPPKLYTDAAQFARARAAVITGGDMRVTPRGIA